MKRFLAICLAATLAMSFGCGGGNDSGESGGTSSDAPEVKMGSLIDPVDGKPVDIGQSEYSWIYKDTEYHFNSKDNFEKFKEDPEKYLD